MRKPKLFISQDHLEAYINRNLNNDKVDDPQWPVPKSVGVKPSDFACRFDFRECVFDFEVDFEKMNFTEEVDFSDAIFNKEANFKGGKFAKRSSFRFCNFKDRAVFREVKFATAMNFFRANFVGRADFRRSKFAKMVDFEGAKFVNRAFFHHAVFKDDVNFKFALFEKEADFYDVTFSTVANFELCVFKFRAFFNEIKQVEPKKRKTELNFVSALFASTAHFNNCKLQHIDLKSVHTDKVITFHDSEVINANRETYRVLKNQFLKENNRVLALQFYRREMNERMSESLLDAFPFELATPSDVAIHLPETSGFSLKRKQDVSLRQMLLSTFELLSLTLHRLSNSHGTSWGRGLLFFFASTFTVFFFFWLTLEGNHLGNIDDHFHAEGFDMFLQYYPQFINPAHKISLFEEGMQLSGFSYVLDLLGRVISTYAIYQIVQAFRKYRAK